MPTLPDGHRRFRRSRGETLIEAMVAMAIFSVALLGILEMNLLARGQLSTAGRETKLANVGRDLMDAFERLPYANPAFAVGAHALGDAALVDDTANTPLLGAAQPILALDVPASTTVGWTCTADNDADGNAQGVQVEIDVTFHSLGQQTKTLKFYTYKYNVAAVVGGNNGAPEI
jgi:type IV pilus assembly protein PilV